MNVKNLFVYGSLLDEKTFEEITGLRLQRRKKAILKGYAFTSPKFGHPVIHPDDSGEIEGEIIFGLDDKTFMILDDYEDEGELYKRKIVTVKSAGEEVKTFVYEELEED